MAKKETKAIIPWPVALLIALAIIGVLGYYGKQKGTIYAEIDQQNTEVPDDAEKVFWETPFSYAYISNEPLSEE